jgi:geranylgeranyl diphosphate synthase, type II
VKPMGFDLKGYLTARQQLVESYLGDLLSDEKDAPPSLVEAMRYSLLAPGKRLRPVLVFMAAKAAGGEDRQALPAAAAVEMIHTYSLIHDDLPAMDDDDLRRGLPTCHMKYGEALATLAGDALLTLSFQVLAEHFPSRTAAGCCLALASGSGAAGMVGGQVEDLAWESVEASARRGERTVEALEHIHQQKTGALFRACLALGVWSAQGERPDGPDRDLLQRLETYGRCFGLVFQITDDLIDVEGHADHAGKGVGKDAARGKLTYPGLLGAQESRRRAHDLGAQALAAVGPLGPAGQPLAELMQFVLARDR